MKVSQEDDVVLVEVDSSGCDNLAFLEQLAASHSINLDQPPTYAQIPRQTNHLKPKQTLSEPSANTHYTSSTYEKGHFTSSNDVKTKNTSYRKDLLEESMANKNVEPKNLSVMGSTEGKSDKDYENTLTVCMNNTVSFEGDKSVPSPGVTTLSFSPKEKWRILKNVTVVSVAFMFQFTAFQGTANLQSSINAKDGLGTVSLSAIYAALVASCVLVPTLLIRRLTVKWTLSLSMLCYAPYIAAQFYPQFFTLVPTAVIVGLGAAPMWASKATYLTQVGGVYAKLTNQPVDAIVVRFFGFFFLAWQTAELWGNLISSVVLSSGGHGGGGDLRSVTTNQTPDTLHLCGANFCVSAATESNDNLERPPDSEIFEISAIYLTCVVIAVAIIAIFLDPLSRYGEKQRSKDPAGEMTGLQLMAATAFQLKNPYQMLLIPITVWIGMEQAFIGADFTQAYVSCALGIPQVGYVMMCFGVVNAICSVLFGSAMKFVGRSPLMGLGAMAHASLLAVLFLWRPHPDAPYVFFAISGLWGIGDAVWQTQVNGLYGTLFRRNKEAAFSNFRLWESAGFVVAYAYSTHLCARMKLYVMMVVLSLGIAGYVAVEALHRRRLRRRALKEALTAALNASAAAVRGGLEEDKEIKAARTLAAAAAEAAGATGEAVVPEWENDDLDDDLIVTHL
ncbi:UNC93-like protein [Hetaerina americana]|uniref:UNC93-like protein n=1 Tax=Hetaerina americana TaxID=62018 RepID=UPI003A7F2761